jgi:prepilin-type N-terminal cleavage/methylation domain-containing protein
MNPFSSTPNLKFEIRNSKLAFTLVELLVVITIIGLLAALVVGGAGFATVKARIWRVQSERQALVTAIEQYKAHKGYYPPDNTNNPASSALFYELTGAISTNNGAAFIGVNQEVLTTAQLTLLFNTGGIVNSSSDTNNPAENFVGSVAKSMRTGSFYVSGNSGPTYTLFGVPVPPGTPASMIMATTTPITPWSYVSSNPTNNSTEFDLWMDVVWRQKTNRISNWAADPQPLN